jgi:hypothetical protein
MRRRIVWLVVVVLVWAIIAAVVYRYIAKHPESPPLRVGMTEEEVGEALGGYTQSRYTPIYPEESMVEYMSAPDALGRGHTVAVRCYRGRVERWEVIPWSGERPPWLDRIRKLGR